MRMTALVAAALLVAPAAEAQSYAPNCRGETMSALARCAARSAPQATVTPLGTDPGETLTARSVQPRSLGGALQPSNLRAEPPVVGGSASLLATTPASPGVIAGFDPLSGLTDDPASPVYGLGGINGQRRTMFDPMAGSGIGNYGIPIR